jgi:DNA polymerase-3 subunit gamma/tau
VSLEQFVSMWTQILESVKVLSRVAWLAFSGSRPVSLSNGVLAVAVDSQGKIKNIKDSSNDERLRHAILDVLHADVRIDVILDPSVTSPAAGPVTSAQTSTSTAPPAPAEIDAPSLDDADEDGMTGIDLALRELGATRIGEIEH